MSRYIYMWYISLFCLRLLNQCVAQAVFQDSGKFYRKEDLYAAIFVFFVQKDTFPIRQVENIEVPYDNSLLSFSVTISQKNFQQDCRAPPFYIYHSLILSIYPFYNIHSYLIVCKLLSALLTLLGSTITLIPMVTFVYHPVLSDSPNLLFHCGVHEAIPTKCKM
jgi:hypothetical protein